MVVINRLYAIRLWQGSCFSEVMSDIAIAYFFHSWAAFSQNFHLLSRKRALK